MLYNALASDFVWLFPLPTGAGFAAVDGIDASTGLGTLKLWTPARGVVTLPASVRFLRFSPDGKYMGWLDNWSPDGKCVVFGDPSDELYVGAVKVAVMKDSAAPVATVTSMGGFVRFIDTHRLLYLGESAAGRGRLALYDADSGASTDIHGYRRRCGRTRRWTASRSRTPCPGAARPTACTCTSRRERPIGRAAA